MARRGDGIYQRGPRLGRRVDPEELRQRLRGVVVR